MILRQAAALLLCLTPTMAYLTEANNAHVELLLTTPNNGAPAQLQLQQPDHLETLLQNKLWGKHTPTSILADFEDWIERFERKYENLVVKGERLLVWLANHGAFLSILLSIYPLYHNTQHCRSNDFIHRERRETALIESHNANPAASSFSLAHNEYSDLTFDEFQRRFNLHRKPDIRKSSFNFLEDEKETAQKLLRGDRSSSVVATSRRLEEEGIDWADKGLTGPIRNQGLCGACWAFSAIGSIESAMAIKKFNGMTPEERSEDWDIVDVNTKGNRVTEQLGLVIPLSEQNLIDCDTVNQQGCDGGL